MPGVLVSQYSPVKGRSVPFSRSTWNCMGVRSRLHSASLFWTRASLGLLIASNLPRSAKRQTRRGGPPAPDAAQEGACRLVGDRGEGREAAGGAGVVLVRRGLVSQLLGTRYQGAPRTGEPQRGAPPEHRRSG